MTDRREPPPIGPLVPLLALFCLNDIVLIAVQASYASVLAVDYGWRLAALVLLLRSPDAVEALLAAWKPIAWRRFALWLVIAFAASELLERHVEPPLENALPQLVLFHFPPPTSPALRFVDLTFGLALVALSEEWIQRVYFFAVVGPRLRSRAALVLLSSAIFALAHWSAGPAALATTFVFGLIYAGAYLHTGSVLASLLLHYVANLIVFV